MTFWADWYMFQWDMLIEEKMQIPEETFHSNMEILQFKQPNETSYKLYREFFQVLDCAMLDYKYLEFDGKLIVLAFICLLLWGYLMKITLKSIAERYNEIYREDSQGLYRLFSEFLKRTNKCKLYDIASVMEFCSKHFSLELEYDYPLATKLNRENVLEVYISIYINLIIYISLFIYIYIFIYKVNSIYIYYRVIMANSLPFRLTTQIIFLF